MIAYTFEYNELTLRVVQILGDNFVYLISHGDRTVLIDAGDADPILDILAQKQLQLTQLLITHNHADHTDGCLKIHQQTGVLARSPALESGRLDLLGYACDSMAVMGHLPPHKLFYFPEPGWVFAGDILINGACGRIINGTAAELFESLQKIAALPDDTRIFGGHDYLIANLKFAEAIDPNNAAIQARMDRYQSDPKAALFLTVAEEKQTNPFLRAKSIEEFAELRRLKDQF